MGAQKERTMSKKHLGLMLICCLVPLVAYVAILYFAIPVDRAVLFGLALFCPISHLIMMRFMPHAHGASHSPETQSVTHHH